MPLAPSARDALRRVGMATLATALLKRGLRRQMVQDVRPLSPPWDRGMMGLCPPTNPANLDAFARWQRQNSR